MLVHEPLGDSLVVELSALDRAALVRIQVPQPYFSKAKDMLSLICHYVLPLTCIFSLSLILTRLMIWANITDVPSNRSSHFMPTPTAGGGAVVLSFFMGAALFFYLDPPSYNFAGQMIGLVVGAILLGVSVSFLDDISHVPYSIRLFVQGIIAVIFVFTDLKIHCPILEGFIGGAIIEFFLTLLFIVFVTNAANFVDGLNGLLSGSILMAIPFMVLTTLLMPGTASSDYWTYLIGMSLWSSLLGFYYYNFPKGRIFLGDVGSVFIGLMIGVIALIGQKGHPEQPTWLVVHARLFLLIYPLGFIWFDPVFTVTRRFIKGRSPFEPNRDFLLHLLNRAGYSHSAVSGFYYISVFVLGTLALLTPLGYMSFIGLVVSYLVLQITFIFWVFSQAKKAGISL